MVAESRQYRPFNPNHFSTQEFCDEKEIWSVRFRRQFALKMRLAYIAKHGHKPPAERYRYRLRYIYSDVKIAEQILKSVIERTA